jgi:glycosyltransferase involved in cell wall biosynthesis
MNDNKNIKVSIIIPTYNRSQSLERALRSIAGLDFPREQFEVVVVDNNSSDATPEVADKFRNAGISLKYVKETRLSFTVARHAGAEAATGKILSYIDDDVIVSNRWLKAVIEVFEGDDTVGIVGGPIYPMFEVEPPAWIQKYHPMSGWLSLMDRGPNLHETNNAYGPNLSIRKDVLNLVGGFPADTIGVEAEGRPGVVEKIYVGSGDVGLCAKLRKEGYKVMYVPAALVYHVIPPVRLTKKWWRSRLAGEGCYHALTQQYEKEEGPTKLFVRGLFSIFMATKSAMRFAECAVTKTGKERYEFWISYFLCRARVEFALARRPDLARRLWSIALTGLQPQDINQLVQLLP